MQEDARLKAGATSCSENFRTGALVKRVAGSAGWILYADFDGSKYGRRRSPQAEHASEGAQNQSGPDVLPNFCRDRGRTRGGALVFQSWRGGSNTVTIPSRG